MKIRKTMERESYPDRASYARALGVRVVCFVLALLLCVLLPPALVPLGVAPGLGADLLIAACQIVFGIATVLAVSPVRSPVWNILCVLFVAGAYWTISRLEVGMPFVIVVFGAWTWISMGNGLQDGYAKRRTAGDLAAIKEEAKRTRRVFVLFVCAVVVVCLNLFHGVTDHPRLGKVLHEILCAMLLVTLVGAMVAYLHYRLAMLKIALLRGNTPCDPVVKGEPSEDDGPTARGSQPPDGKIEQN